MSNSAEIDAQRQDIKYIKYYFSAEDPKLRSELTEAVSSATGCTILLLYYQKC